jgi:hypothetical protein
MVTTEACSKKEWHFRHLADSDSRFEEVHVHPAAQAYHIDIYHIDIYQAAQA